MRFVSMINMMNMMSMIRMTSIMNIMNMMTMIMDLGIVAPLNVKVHLLLHGFNPAYLHGLQVRRVPLALKDHKSNLHMVDSNGHR